MVSASRIEVGPQILSAGVRKTIQSIKEVVGNHSDIEIYWALKETNMDPNETTQKLLNQDPFHEVKRKKDKKKESVGYEGSTEPRRHSEPVGQEVKANTHSDRNSRRGGYSRNALPGVSKEFRVVRDNRVNRNINKESKPVVMPAATSTIENVSSGSGKGSIGSSSSQKLSDGRILSQGLNKSFDSHFRIVQDIDSSGSARKEVSEEKRVVQAGKANNPRSQPAMVASSSSAIGVYSSSTDPVHVPSPDSRSSGSVGAIKREVGVVGVRRQSSDNSKQSVAGSSLPNSILGGEGATESLQSFNTISKKDELSQTHESIIPSMSVSRSLLSHYGNRQPHQQPVGHQKASQNKEWKPKSSQKPSLNGPGVIGTPTKSATPPAHNSKDLDDSKVHDQLSRVNIHENQNVIIAQHIRVPETDRCHLTFGSFGKDFDSSHDLVNGFQAGSAAVEANDEHAASLSAPESITDEASSSKQVDLIDEKNRNSESDSQTSGAVSDDQLADKKESSSPPNLDSYSDIGLVQDNSPSYTPSESQQQPDHPELPGFSAYDPQSGYDIPYFRPAMEEAMRGQALPSHQEALSSHNPNVPSSTIAMVQQQPQQQPPVPQMYPSVHVSHFANLIPYRQYLPPQVYVPPMAMPGYSNNPAYPHPSNGNSYVLMPGGGTHLNANSLKYGVQQYKPVPAGSPTGFGNFSNPNGYAISNPGVVGGASGHEDSSRIKYKDCNLYVPNPQAETSEIWIQNPRELPGLQSTPYYNMPGQSPHAAYMPSHTGHASFNAAAAQSSHMQFPGLYHPSQPTAIANPHHLGPAMGGNVGVGVAAAAPGAQVGAYQQPQLGHINWTTNF
ncbi:GBF-interacting protein 1-like [Cannabis sativa]|uniref:GBF-interacting protein 1-like n=1 Tax=Cannabis sativa TaxID=3483 RepID=UPI0029C9D929|nr:GBF-interacting protein 1-like [Cannabis sativa]